MIRLPKKFSYFSAITEKENFSGWARAKTNSLEWDTPLIQSKDLRKIFSLLEKSRNAYLKKIPDEVLISVLGQVAIRWLDPEYPLRRTAMNILPASTGCSPQVISEGLNLAFREVQPHHLKSALRLLTDLPKPKLLALIFAGIIPTPMLFDLFLGLMLRSAIIAKSPSREPFFPILLAHSIHEIDPELANGISALWWPGGKWNLERTLFKEADLIHAYGDNETLDQIKAHVRQKKKLLKFGHRISFAFIPKESLKKDDHTLPERLAYDIALYDQQGCMSPHVVYVEEGGPITPNEWAELLAQAFPLITEKFPPPDLTLGEASQIQQIRGQYYSKGEQICFSSYPTTAWTVVYENQPVFHPSCSNRFIFVKPIDNLRDLSKILKPWKGSFESLGYAGSDEIANKLGKIALSLKIPHLHSIGSMQVLTFQEHVQERVNLAGKSKKS